MRFNQILLAIAITFSATAMARDNQFFCREHRIGECCSALRDNGEGRDCIDARQLDRGADFKDDENKFECRDHDDKSPFCCKRSDHERLQTSAYFQQFYHLYRVELGGTWARRILFADHIELGTMSIFFSTHHLESETPLPTSISREAAVAFLHDHTAFQNLQPLVTDNKVIASPPPTEWIVTEAVAVSSGAAIDYRSITISVPFGPLGSSSITTTSASIDTDDGLIVVFHAPLGLHGRNQYRVIATEDGQGLVLREEAKLTGISLLMPFVLGKEKESHALHRGNVAQELERRASAK
ncbi:hypothetical protein EG329_014281 [Mollisiaceae sp. DMI_Dod_QoI]|nr:hypothetical protein EG329_014281 [Helotiales sp. DMI_Dod_QoI]